MASVHRSVDILAPAARVWHALADLGALHTRLVPGFVVDCRLDGELRSVTFANGLQVTETIVDGDPVAMRVAWSARGGALTHHNASAQVVAAGEGACTVTWAADLLPHDMARPLAGMIEEGLTAMKRCFEAPPAA